MQRNRNDLALVSCSGGRKFAKSIDDHLLQMLGAPNHSTSYLIPSQDIWFPGSEQINDDEQKPEGVAVGEMKTVLKDSVRGKHVVVVQDVAGYQPTENLHSKGIQRELELHLADKYLELRSAVRAIRDAKAEYITIVVPYFPFSRQEKRTNDPKTGSLKEAIMAAMVAEDFERDGAGSVLTLDIHNEAIAGFFRNGVELINIYAARDFIPYIVQYLGLESLVAGAPDAGAVPRTKYYANILKSLIVMGYKQKNFGGSGGVDKIILLGDVLGKIVLEIDDIIARAGTLKELFPALKEGQAKLAYFAASLPTLTGPAKRIIRKLYEEGLLHKIIVTDAIDHGDYFEQNKDIYAVVSVAGTFAEVIREIHYHGSPSSLFKTQAVIDRIQPYLNKK